MPTNKSVKQDEYKQTRQLVKSLINTFPQYKNYKEQDFIDMLEKISAVESRNKNVKQLEGGPGRGYFQMELRSAPISRKRAENTLNALKKRGVKIPKLPRFSEDFTQLSKDEQAFYVVNNLIGAAGSKREQGQKDYYLNPTKPKDVWTDLHWAGKDKDKPARVKHWEEIHGKDQQPVAQEMPQAPPSEIGWSDIAKTYLQFPMAPQFAAGMAYTKLFGPEQSEVEVPEQQASGGLIKRKDGSYSKRGLWDNIRANRGSGRKPTAEMLRQERKIRAAEKKEDGGWLDAYDNGGPIYNWIPEKYPRVGARYGDGSWVEDSSIPTPTTPSYYPDYGDPTLTNYQMGTPKAPMYGPGGKVKPPFNTWYKTVNPNFADTTAYDLRQAYQNLSFKDLENWRINPDKYHLPDTYKYPNHPTFSDESIYFNPKTKKYAGHWTETDSSWNYVPYDTTFKKLVVEKKANGGPVKYAAGATVWTKQTTPSWVAGTPTRTTTQMITPQRAQSPGTQVPYPEIKITGPTNPYAPSSNVMKGYNPYKGPMRLHAPDTTVITKSEGSYGRMHALGGAVGAPFHHGDVLSKKNTYNHGFANGGYVPMYKSGGFMSGLEDVGKLLVNTVAAPMEQVTGNNFVNWDYNNQWAADTAAVSEGLAGAGADIAGSIFLGPAYGMAKGQLQGITSGLGNSTEEQKGAKDWANKTGQIASSAGDFTAGILSGNPQQIVGGAGNLLGTAGSEFGSEELQGIGQLAGLASSFVNPGQGGGNTMMKTPSTSISPTGSTIPGMDLSTLGIGIARNGGHITKKYNPPGLRYQALNPGVSDPSGMYVGPTTQRGITFEDGGDTPKNNPYMPNTPLATGAAESVMGPIDYALLPSQLPFRVASTLGRGAVLAAEAFNPISGLKPTPGMMYRGIGKEGFEDAMKSKVLRPQQQGYAPKRSIKEIVSSPKQFNRTYFTPDVNVAKQYGKTHVAVTPQTEEFLKRYGNKDWSWSIGRELPLNEVELYKKNLVGSWRPVNPKKQSGGWLDNMK